MVTNQKRPIQHTKQNFFCYFYSMPIQNLIFTILFSCGIVFGLVFFWYLRFYKKYTDKSTSYLLWFLATFTANNIQILWVDLCVHPADCYLKNLHPFFFFVFVVPYFHAFMMSYLKIESKVFRFTKLAQLLFAVGMLARVALSPLFDLDRKSVV